MEEPRLPPGFSRETTIRRDAQGRWFHDGDPVENPAVARAFDRWIDRADDGRWCLKNSANWAYVEIEGAPIFVRDLRLEGGAALLELSDERSEPLEPSTLRRDRAGVLYCTVRGGRLPAQFTRRAMWALEPVVAEDEAGVYLALSGAKVRPPEVAEPLAGTSAGSAGGG